jgi:hypothetical protein
MKKPIEISMNTMFSFLFSKGIYFMILFILRIASITIGKFTNVIKQHKIKNCMLKSKKIEQTNEDNIVKKTNKFKPKYNLKCFDCRSSLSLQNKYCNS